MLSKNLRNWFHINLTQQLQDVLKLICCSFKFRVINFVGYVLYELWNLIAILFTLSFFCFLLLFSLQMLGCKHDLFWTIMTPSEETYILILFKPKPFQQLDYFYWNDKPWSDNSKNKIRIWFIYCSLYLACYSFLYTDELVPWRGKLSLAFVAQIGNAKRARRGVTFSLKIMGVACRTNNFSSATK